MTGTDAMVDRPRARVRVWQFWSLAFLAWAGLTVLAICLPHNPYVRYQGFEDTTSNRLTWIYERIRFDPTPIDVVILGTSREAAAFDAQMVQDALALRGYDLHVADLSLPGIGLDLRTSILKQLLDQKKPRLVILPLSETLPRTGHKLFVEVADPMDVIVAPPLNRYYVSNLFRLPMRQIEASLQTRLGLQMERATVFDPLSYDGPVPRYSVENWRNNVVTDPWSFDGTAEEHRRQLEHQSKILLSSFGNHGVADGVDPILLMHPTFYLDAMTQQIAAAGAKSAFTFLPFFGGPGRPFDENKVQEYGPIWSANVDSSDPKIFTDALHLEEGQRMRMSEWLAMRIIEAL